MIVDDPQPPYLFLDTYKDENERPDFTKLGPPYVGVILKATEGLHYAPDWFYDAWRAVRAAHPVSYGATWFRGAYHFLRMTRDGAAQADAYLAHVDRAGGWDVGDMLPIVDVESADNAGATAQDVVLTTSAFADRVREVTGRPVMLYGRGMLRDLGINDRMGCARAICPSYTATMIQHGLEVFGLENIPLWQYAGDGQGDASIHHLPLRAPLRGDVSVFIDGKNKPTMSRLRELLIDPVARVSPVAPAING